MKSKKLYIVLLASTVLFIGGILSAFTLLQDNRKGEKTPTTSTAKETAPVTVKSEQQLPVTKASDHTVIYYASLKEGIIGSYGGKQIDNPADNFFTVKLGQSVNSSDKVYLQYTLTGVGGTSAVAHSINDRLSTGGYLVHLTDKATLQKEPVNPEWLVEGANRILFSLPQGADYGYKVSGLALVVEKATTNRQQKEQLVITSANESVGKKAYIRGFISADSKAVGVAVLGKNVSLNSGEFETVVSVPEDRTVSITASDTDGKVVAEKKIVFDRDFPLNNEIAFSENKVQTIEKTIQKGSADSLFISDATLNMPVGTLLETKNISITTLRTADMPALDVGMVNVTSSNEGYRFLPHGENFTTGGAYVSLKYDRTRIPSGYTENDIHTYYFDNNTGHWEALERDSIDRSLCMVVSKTTHFTDMINGVIKTPESPETQGFAPTMMSDIKAADPTAKVALIAPPTANRRGSAGLSYSFEMPPARNGMQPSLGIQYNSDGGSGLLGEGWDISISGITVDTRWGVPRYNDAKETETYSMNGAMLMMIDDNGQSAVAHRGDKINRTADRRFYARQEESFSEIVRKGDSPSNYYWEITDKSGTKYIYGLTGALKGTVKTIDEQQKEGIAEWKLTRVEELHGDWIEYKYETVNEPVRGNLTAKAIYLKEVRAGNKNSDAHTVVSLIYRNNLKTKQTNSARYGFFNSNNRLLDKVEIRFENELLRTYAFDYAQGAFNAETLVAVKHFDQQGILFAEHTMDYYDDVKSNEGYKPFVSKAETWNTWNDDINAGFVNPVEGPFSDKASALGGSKTTSISGSVFAGVGLGVQVFNKELSAGASYSYTNSTTSGLTTLIDINGDGLPDKVCLVPKYVDLFSC